MLACRHLRVQAARERDGIADPRVQQPGGGLAQQHAERVAGLEVGAGGHDVQPLSLRLHAVADQGHE